MKRLLIATLALTTILTACSDEDRIEMFDKQAYVDDKAAEEERMNETEESKVDDAIHEVNSKLVTAIEAADTSKYETQMDSVIIRIEDVSRYDFAHGTRIDVEYYVENTIKERRYVPLAETVLITDDGLQVDSDPDMNNEPQADLHGATKTTGTVSFYLEDVEVFDINAVDIVIPGVGFRTDLAETFEYEF